MGPAVKVDIGGPRRGARDLARSGYQAARRERSEWRRSGGSSAEAAADREPASGLGRHGLRRGDAPDRADGDRGDAAAPADAQRRGALSRDQEPADAARARRDPFENLAPLFTGPTAIAFSQDPVAAAKAAVEYANRNNKLTIVGGGLQGQAARRGRRQGAGDAAVARRAARQDHRPAQRAGDQAGGAAADPGRPAGAGVGGIFGKERRGEARSRVAKGHASSNPERVRRREIATLAPKSRFGVGDKPFRAQSGVGKWLIWQSSSTICRR